MPNLKKYEVTHAPCAVCQLPIELNSAQKKRVTEGKSMTHGGQCKAIHQKRTYAMRSRKHIDSLPAAQRHGEVTCAHCKRAFVPLPDVQNRHNRGEHQKYFCGNCVGKAPRYPTERFPLERDPYEQEQEARRQVIRDAYFKGIMPDVRHYRRAW